MKSRIFTNIYIHIYRENKKKLLKRKKTEQKYRIINRKSNAKYEILEINL